VDISLGNSPGNVTAAEDQPVSPGDAAAEYLAVKALGFDFLVDESRRAVDRLVDVWRQYMAWYSFAFTSNLVALSWIGLNREYLLKVDDGTLRTPAMIFSSMWIVLNVLNLAGCVMIKLHTREVGKRVGTILDAAYAPGNIARPMRAAPNFNFRLSGFAADGNGVALAAFISLWAYIGLRAAVAGH
jgi:hypothetical protein